MPGEPGVAVVTMLVCFFIFACEAAGALSARHSLRPLMFQKRKSNRNNSRACGENVEVCLTFVVPAKAGTHTPCRSFERRCSMTFAQQLRPVVIGPLVRGDDTDVIARSDFSDEAIHLRSGDAEPWIASLALAMTAMGRIASPSCDRRAFT